MRAQAHLFQTGTVTGCARGAGLLPMDGLAAGSTELPGSQHDWNGGPTLGG